jgi:hypothetical protein
LREVSPDDVLPGDETPSKVEALRARLAAVREDIAGLQADLRGGYSKALAAVLREREAAEVELASELQDQLARDAKPLRAAWEQLPSLVDLIAEKGDEARLKLRTVLRRVVAEAWVLIVPRGGWRLCVVQFFFQEGGRRDYLIYYQPANKYHSAQWSARSLGPDLTGALELDLRRRDHTARLEKVLMKMEISA